MTNSTVQPSDPTRQSRTRLAVKRSARPKDDDEFIPDGYLAVGKIVAVHGLRGEVNVELYTDFPERFAPGVILFAGDDLSEMEVQQARPHKGHILLTFAGVTDRTQAEEMRGWWLLVDEEHAVELDDNSYWVHDILGMSVETEQGERLGVVQDVLFTGANEVYVVAPHHPEEGNELLLPAIKDVVRRVDLSARVLTVHLLPGLREDSDEQKQATA